MRQYVRILATDFLLVMFSLGVLGLRTSAASLTRGQAPARNSANYQAWLTKEVRHQLVMLPWYSVFDNLEYKVDGNNVTLMGQVVRPDLKDDSARAVKSIEGVGKVDNQIKVLPTSNMDDGIRRAEFRAIYSYPALQLYGMEAIPPIHIIVANGHVTLVGVVNSQGDKDAAGLRANMVPNVFSVTNNIVVENSNQKPKSK